MPQEKQELPLAQQPDYLDRVCPRKLTMASIVALGDSASNGAIVGYSQADVACSSGCEGAVSVVSERSKFNPLRYIVGKTVTIPMCPEDL